LTMVEARERKRLAMILHDDVCQLLASSKLIVDLQMDTGLPELSMNALGQVGTMLELAAEQSHDLTFDLSTPTLYELGLAKAIQEWLAKEIEGKHHVFATFADHGIPESIDEDVAVFIFRSIRELAFNAIKHAQPQNLAVSVGWHEDQIEVEVIDDGEGFNYETLGEERIKGGGFGLFSIKERLEYMGGEFLVDSQNGRGTRIVLNVPVELEMVSQTKKGDGSSGYKNTIG
jgi:signal transduction histidine kinase